MAGADSFKNGGEVPWGWTLLMQGTRKPLLGAVANSCIDENGLNDSCTAHPTLAFSLATVLGPCLSIKEMPNSIIQIGVFRLLGRKRF